MLKVDEENGIVQVADIDAFNGTSIVDLKAYFPVCDRVKSARILSGIRTSLSGCLKKE